MRIYLVGLKNSGKTTTGKNLANKLNLTFVDLDELIETLDGRTVPELYSQEGDAVFRDIERKALEQTTEMEDVVVATGGGAPRYFDNMELMLKTGICIYLRLDEDTLVERLIKASANRPVVKGKTAEEIRAYVRDIIQNHEHVYLKSQLVVDAQSLAPNDLVDSILSTGNKLFS